MEQQSENFRKNPDFTGFFDSMSELMGLENHTRDLYLVKIGFNTSLPRPRYIPSFFWCAKANALVVEQNTLVLHNSIPDKLFNVLVFCLQCCIRIWQVDKNRM